MEWLRDNLLSIVPMIIAVISIIMQLKKNKKDEISELIKKNTELEVKIGKIETELKWLTQITPSLNKLVDILDKNMSDKQKKRK